jgi:hypothetical protein
MFKIIAGVIVLLIAGLLGYAATRHSLPNLKAIAES